MLNFVFFTFCPRVKSVLGSSISNTGVNVESRDIQGWHLMRIKSRTIVKSYNRKDCSQMLNVKPELKDWKWHCETNHRSRWFEKYASQCHYWQFMDVNYPLLQFYFYLLSFNIDFVLNLTTIFISSAHYFHHFSKCFFLLVAYI